MDVMSLFVALLQKDANSFEAEKDIADESRHRFTYWLVDYLISVKKIEKHEEWRVER